MVSGSPGASGLTVQQLAVGSPIPKSESACVNRQNMGATTPVISMEELSLGMTAQVT